MPVSLRQLQQRHDQCLEKIEELKSTAERNGAATVGAINFNAIGFFQGLTDMADEDLQRFLDFFPQLPRILEMSRQAANEEVKRRKYEVDIEKHQREAMTRAEHKFKVAKKKKERTKRRLQKLRALPAQNQDLDSSQE